MKLRFKVRRRILSPITKSKPPVTLSVPVSGPGLIGGCLPTNPNQGLLEIMPRGTGPGAGSAHLHAALWPLGGDRAPQERVPGILGTQPETSAHTAEAPQPLDRGSTARLSGPHPLHPSTWGSRFQWEPGLDLNTGSAHSLAKDLV